MTMVIADISISLDGYVTGPDPEHAGGLGRGGEPLHTWATGSEDPVDAEVLATGVAESGAVVLGRRLFDVVDAPDGWSDEMGYGAAHASRPAFFVVTHRAPEKYRLTHLDVTFVTDGVAAAIDRARDAAGGRHVVLMGGGDIIKQALDEALVDELRLHVAPLILGGGTPLFGTVRRELSLVSTVTSPHAVHLTYRL